MEKPQPPPVETRTTPRERGRTLRFCTSTDDGDGDGDGDNGSATTTTTTTTATEGRCHVGAGSKQQCCHKDLRVDQRASEFRHVRCVTVSRLAVSLRTALSAASRLHIAASASAVSRVSHDNRGTWAAVVTVTASAAALPMGCVIAITRNAAAAPRYHRLQLLSASVLDVMVTGIYRR
jgi:hypothetical protein